MKSTLKSLLIMAIPTALFVLLGWLFGRATRIGITLALASIMNLVLYFSGHEVILWYHGVVKLHKRLYPRLYEVTRRLWQQAGIPMPGLYLFYTPQPNAFANRAVPS